MKLICYFFHYQKVAIEEEEENSSDEEKKVKSDVNKEKEKEPKVVDIEDSIADTTMEQKKLDKLRFVMLNTGDCYCI